MYQVFIILCTIIGVLARDYNILEQLSPKELQAIFGSTKDRVPEFKVIPVSHGYTKKAGRRHRIIQLPSFEKDITLYLEPTDGQLAGVKTPVFTAKSSKNGIEFDRIHNAIRPEHRFYQDIFNFAALVIKRGSDGKALLNGIIDTFAIRPLPARFRSQFKRDKRSGQDEFLQSNRTVYQSNLENTHYHVIYRIPSTEKIDMKSRPSVTITPRRRLRKKNKVPSVIHPQILVTMESSLFNIFNQDTDDVLNYILSFWNAVDLRYRVFRDPDVRVNIAGIVLAKDPHVTPYIVKNRITIENQLKNKIEVSLALRNMSQFLFHDSFYNESDNTMTNTKLGIKHDLVITMTSYDMCQFENDCFETDEYTCDTDDESIGESCRTLGYAYYTGACAYDEKGLMEAVGIVKDKGGFGGIIPTAHEIGHLLGASHNPSNSLNDCPMADGYIMSDQLEVSVRSFAWSECSVRSIKRFLTSDSRAQCLFDKPETGNQAARILPGKFFSRDKQCERIMGAQSCQKEGLKDSCDKLYCQPKHRSDGDSCSHAYSIPVPEGSPCGRGFHCINGRCIREEERNVVLKLGTRDQDKQD